jgi:hypothetical protein
MISWSDWPARRRPLVSILAAGVIGVVVFVISTLDMWLAILAAALLIGVCAEALLPTRFTVTDEGVQVASLFRRGHKPWQRIDGWWATEAGFVLHGAKRAGSLRYRDLWLRCPDQLDTIESRLRLHLGTPRGSQQ